MDLPKREQLSSLFWLIFAGIFCVSAIQLPWGTLEQPGAGFLPLLGGTLLGLLSFINLLTTFKKKKASVKAESLNPNLNWKNIILTLAVLFTFPLLLLFIGFAPTTFLFFALLLRFIKPQKWVIVLGGSATATLLLYFIFQVWLKIKFPVGFLGI
jgi:putative tricarboxylic transport membrane protein